MYPLVMEFPSWRHVISYVIMIVVVTCIFILNHTASAADASTEAVMTEPKEEWKAIAWKALRGKQSLLQFKFPRAPHFFVAAEEWPPHIYVRNDGKQSGSDGGSSSSSMVLGKTTVTGPMGKLLDELARSINFTYSVIQGDGYWGAPQQNGSWNGMIGTVLRKDADIGLGPFGMSYTRSQVVDFTTPVFIEMLHVLVNRPLPVPDPWGFLTPFTWNIWAGLLVTMVGMIVTSFATTKILGFGGPKSPGEHIWAFYSIAFSQNLPWKPHGLALRLTFWFWMAIIVVVIRSYSGSLTALLAVKTVPVKYDSLRDVLDDPSLTLLMEGSTALTAHLQKVKEGIYYELAEASRKRAKYVRASETYGAAYSLIPDGTHAMLVENVVCRKIYSDHFSITGRCDFYMSTGNFWRLIYAMIVQKGSPLRELINSRIHSITEFGIYERWASDQMPNMTHCLKMPTKVKLQEPYHLLDLGAVFLILGGGIFLASLVFLGEILVALNV